MRDEVRDKTGYQVEEIPLYKEPTHSSLLYIGNLSVITGPVVTNDTRPVYKWEKESVQKVHNRKKQNSLISQL